MGRDPAPQGRLNRLTSRVSIWSPDVTEDSSHLTSLQPANSPSAIDLRRIGAHPDYWYPVAWSNELKPGKTLGGVSRPTDRPLSG